MSKHVISFHYTLTDKDGKQLDASQEGHPLIFLSGAGQIIPGLEEVLVAMKTDEEKTVTVAAKDAYGEFNPKLVFQVKRAQLPKADLTIGDMFEAGGNQGQSQPVTVTAINGDEVTLDGNHPLAGQDLTFNVKIAERREPTVQEVAHGHVHGAGGCNH